jgi:hypothetical protein
MEAKTRGHSASCAYESAISSTHPCSLVWPELVRKGFKEVFAEFVLRILFANWDRARLSGSRISNQQQLKIILSNVFFMLLSAV